MNEIFTIHQIDNSENTFKGNDFLFLLSDRYLRKPNDNKISIIVTDNHNKMEPQVKGFINLIQFLRTYVIAY